MRSTKTLHPAVLTMALFLGTLMSAQAAVQFTYHVPDTNDQIVWVWGDGGSDNWDIVSWPWDEDATIDVDVNEWVGIFTYDLRDGDWREGVWIFGADF